MMIKPQIKATIKKFVPSSVLDSFYIRRLEKNGLTIKKGDNYLDIKDNSKRCIRIALKHKVYIEDIIRSFEYYFSAVTPLESAGLLLVDYSTPRFHEVAGFDLHPIIFPSFAEPVITTQQYLDFANLEEGSTVLDLGAYSGLTSILFDQLVGDRGRVVSVDADQSNIKCIKKNFNLYQKVTGRTVELLEGAVWKDNNGISFSTEGNMGSSAIEYVGESRGAVNKVKTYTLSTIAKMYNLQKVDFIKCDIEGAESLIFNDLEFFTQYQPRIIIEPHIIDGRSTLDACIAQLTQYGYQLKAIKQHGVHLPLLECYPGRK